MNGFRTAAGSQWQQPGQWSGNPPQFLQQQQTGYPQWQQQPGGYGGLGEGRPNPGWGRAPEPCGQQQQQHGGQQQNGGPQHGGPQHGGPQQQQHGGPQMQQCGGLLQQQHGGPQQQWQPAGRPWQPVDGAAQWGAHVAAAPQQHGSQWAAGADGLQQQRGGQPLQQQQQHGGQPLQQFGSGGSQQWQRPNANDGQRQHSDGPPQRYCDGSQQWQRPNTDDGQRQHSDGPPQRYGSQQWQQSGPGQRPHSDGPPQRYGGPQWQQQHPDGGQRQDADGQQPPHAPRVPTCGCGLPAARKEARQGPNQGRPFYGCPKWSADGSGHCRFFEWADASRPPPGRDSYSSMGNQRSTTFASGGRKTNIDMQLTELQGDGAAYPPVESHMMRLGVAVRLPLVLPVGVLPALRSLQGAPPVSETTVDNARILTFSVQHLQTVHSVLVGMRETHGVDVVGPPKAVLDAVEQERARHRPQLDWDDCSIPRTLQKKLLAFQRESVEYVVSRGGRALIGDEMGLGKTLQAITVMCFYRSDWPVLIICPSSLRFMWKSAILKELPWLLPEEVQVFVQQKKDKTSGLVHIVSYDGARNRDDELAARNYNVVILDEAHFIKNEKSKRAVSVRRIMAGSNRVLLLSGTPALNRPVELFTLVDGVVAHPSHVFCSRKLFCQRYCDAKPSKFKLHGRAAGMDTTGHSNLQELGVLLRMCCMVRRLKADVLTQLPEKTRMEIHLPITPQEKRKMEKEVEHFRSTFASLEELEDEDMPKMGRQQKNRMMELLQATVKAKTGPVTEFLRDVHSSGEKVLVFAHHREMLNAIEHTVEDICKTHNKDSVVKDEGRWSHIRIDGQTDAKARDRLVQLFQTDPGVKYAVLSITACGTGLTLHSSSTVVFAELYWNPGVLCQAEDRVHRIGQPNPCVIKYLLCMDGTSDEFVWPLLNRKLAVLGATLNGGGQSGAGADGSEFVDSRSEFRRRDQPNLHRALGRPDLALVPRGGRPAPAGTQTLADFLASRPAPTTPSRAQPAASPPSAAPVAPPTVPRSQSVERVPLREQSQARCGTAPPAKRRRFQITSAPRSAPPPSTRYSVHSPSPPPSPHPSPPLPSPPAGTPPAGTPPVGTPPQVAADTAAPVAAAAGTGTPRMEVDAERAAPTAAEAEAAVEEYLRGLNGGSVRLGQMRAELAERCGWPLHADTRRVIKEAKDAVVRRLQGPPPEPPPRPPPDSPTGSPRRVPPSESSRSSSVCCGEGDESDDCSPPAPLELPRPVVRPEVEATLRPGGDGAGKFRAMAFTPSRARQQPCYSRADAAGA